MPLSRTERPLFTSIRGSQLIRKKLAMRAVAKQPHRSGVIQARLPLNRSARPVPCAVAGGAMAVSWAAGGGVISVSLAVDGGGGVEVGVVGDG